MIEKQGIINLYSLGSENYAFVVIRDSEVGFLNEEKDVIFRLFLHSMILHSVA